MRTFSTIGLYGAPFAGIDLFMRGIREISAAQIIHVGSGPLAPFLSLAEAWIYLHDEARENIPLVINSGCRVVSRSLPTLPLGLPVVHIDDESAGRVLAEHEIAQGARSIVFWGLPLSFSQRRSAGAKAAANAAGITFTEAGDLPSALDAIRSARQIGPVGFVGMNDEWCHKIAAALHGSEIRVPRDVLLAGFDDAPLPLAPWAVPLTTVTIPLQAQGRRCAERLVSDDPITITANFIPVPPPLLRTSTLRT